MPSAAPLSIWDLFQNADLVVKLVMIGLLAATCAVGAIAVGKAVGPEEGLAELSKIPDPDKLKDYPFYPAARGEFHLLAGRPAEAAKSFEKALNLARNRSETEFFERKLRACQLNEARG